MIKFSYSATLSRVFLGTNVQRGVNTSGKLLGKVQIAGDDYN